MALYDPNDTLVPVQFPDGTMRQLPASLASQLGVHPDQLAPPPLQTLPEYPTTTGVPTLPSQPPPPPPPQRVGTLEYDPNLAGSIALQPPRPPPPPPQKIGAAPGAPSVPYAGEIAAAPQPAAPSGPQIATPDFTAPAGTGGVPAFAPGEPGMPAAPGKPAATEAPPLTEGGLRGMGAAGAANAQLGALGAEKKAGENLADAQANQTLAFADAYEQRNAHIDRMLAQRAAEAQAKQTQIENRITDYDTATKKYADAKPIDREADHPILTAIGVFLAGIGSAWKNESGNPAIDMMFKQIDRKVAAQVQDREKQAQVIGMKRNDIEMLRQRATDSTAQYNLMIAGETERAARQIEALGARSNSDIVRANAAQGAAVLRQKAADVVGAAVMAQQGKDDRDKAFSEQLRHTKVEEKNQASQVSQGWAHVSLAKDAQKESVRQFDLTRKDKLEEFAINKLLAGDAKGSAAAKAQAELGVGDPRTGASLLQPEAKPLLTQADKLEKAARTASPAQAADLRAQAKNIRDQAELQYGFKARDTKEAGEVTEQITSSQQMVDIASKIKAKLAEDPGLTDRKAWASLATDFNQAKVKYIEMNKAKPSSREMEAISEVFGEDPAESLKGRELEVGKLGARIDTMLNTTISDTGTFLKGHRYRGEWLPAATEGEVIPKLDGKTSIERGANAELGVVGKQLSFTTNENRQLKAENQGDITSTALDAKATSVVQQLAKKYANANDAEQAKILTQLSAYAASPRADVAQSVVTLVNAENPGLYKQIVGANPNVPRVAGDDNAQAREQVIQSTPIGSLRDAAIAGDPAAKAEIVRRALGGDRSAQLAAHEVTLTLKRPTGAQIGVPR